MNALPTPQSQIESLQRALADAVQYAQRLKFAACDHITLYDSARLEVLSGPTLEELHASRRALSDATHGLNAIVNGQAKSLLYYCPDHGEWDGLRVSGCPDCIIELRRALANKDAYAERLEAFADEAAWVHIDSGTLERADGWHDFDTMDTGSMVDYEGWVAYLESRKLIERHPTEACVRPLPALDAALAKNPASGSLTETPLPSTAQPLAAGHKPEKQFDAGRSADEPASQPGAGPHVDALTAELADVLRAMVEEHCDYMIRNKLGDPEGQHNIKWARAVLARMPCEVNNDETGRPVSTSQPNGAAQLYSLDALKPVLREHYLRAIECHHASGTDTPHCACCAWPCPAQPNIGQAVERWIEHFIGHLRVTSTERPDGGDHADD